MDIVSLYMTCKDEAEAEKIVRALLDARLIACANILPSVKSIYRWEGKIENSQEVPVRMKTRAARVAEVEAIVLEMHSYELPCLVATPVVDGIPDFMDWVIAETK